DRGAGEQRDDSDDDGAGATPLAPRPCAEPDAGQRRTETDAEAHREDGREVRRGRHAGRPPEQEQDLLTPPDAPRRQREGRSGRGGRWPPRGRTGWRTVR